MKTLIISPHPDDEALGVGGTILKGVLKNNLFSGYTDTYAETRIQYSSNK